MATPGALSRSGPYSPRVSREVEVAKVSSWGQGPPSPHQDVKTSSFIKSLLGCCIASNAKAPPTPSVMLSSPFPMPTRPKRYNRSSAK